MTTHWLGHAFYILDAIDLLESVTDKISSCSDADKLGYVGAIHVLQTLMESAHKLPSDIKKRHSDIDWAKFREIRNEFAHDYMILPEKEFLLSIITNDLPALKDAMLEHVPNWQEIKKQHGSWFRPEKS